MGPSDEDISLVSMAIRARLNGAISDKEFQDIVNGLKDAAKKSNTHACFECRDTLIVLKEDSKGSLTCYSCRCCKNPRYRKV